MKSLAMSIRTTRGVFLVRDIKSVYYVKQPGVPTIYFINEDGREASVPFEEVICFAMCETDVDALSQAQPLAGGTIWID